MIVTNSRSGPWRAAACALLLSTSAAARPAAGPQDHEDPTDRAATALVELLTTPDASAAAWVDEQVGDELLRRVPREELAARMDALRERVAGAAFAGVEAQRPGAATLLFGGGGLRVELRLVMEPPFPVGDVWIPGARHLDPRGKDAPAFTWEGLGEQLDALGAEGFVGSALVVRGGEVVLERCYGMANREAGHPITPETVFAIGSTPIDFTRAGVLLLIEEGKLALDEPLTAFFDDAPPDKRAITVEHMMEGRSGLQDFHDLPGDSDVDHDWIDRAEAVRRILAKPLSFPPGTDREHSHSAWVLLAAILELRSGQRYEEFTRERLFAPLEMDDTGFFGRPVPMERLAIGYGDRRDGHVNAPPWWGPTSWLVMGSGGMVSTARDLLKWNRALRAGKVLRPESLERYWAPPGALLDGGDMYGFEILYTEGPETLFFLLSNAVDRTTRARFADVGEALYRLVQRDGAPPFTLGVMLEPDEERGLVLREVVPGGAAEAAGLRAGDVLVAADGEALLPEPRAVLAPCLRSGEPVRLELLREGERIELVVRPQRR